MCISIHPYIGFLNSIIYKSPLGVNTYAKHRMSFYSHGQLWKQNTEDSWKWGKMNREYEMSDTSDEGYFETYS